MQLHLHFAVMYSQITQVSFHCTYFGMCPMPNDCVCVHVFLSIRVCVCECECRVCGNSHEIFIAESEITVAFAINSGDYGGSGGGVPFSCMHSCTCLWPA